MPTTLTALNLLLFLLPGLLTLKIREALSVVAKETDFSRAVDTLFFSLMNYGLYFVIATLISRVAGLPGGLGLPLLRPKTIEPILVVALAHEHPGS